jgi:hypothetical protein
MLLKNSSAMAQSVSAGMNKCPPSHRQSLIARLIASFFSGKSQKPWRVEFFNSKPGFMQRCLGWRDFFGFGVAEKYCFTEGLGDTFTQCSSGMLGFPQMTRKRLRR